MTLTLIYIFIKSVDDLKYTKSNFTLEIHEQQVA